MLTIHGLDKSKGLDLILHTPGGDLAATESIVDYLYSMFGEDIRVIVPQIAMSAGTMVALAAKEIIMGKHSNLGPIDPQMGGLACQSLLDEFKQATEEVTNNPNSALLWQIIIGKYHPTLLIECQQAIEWSQEIVLKWLNGNMIKNDKNTAEAIVNYFSRHDIHKSHSRHISKKECIDIGLKIISLEAYQDLQDAVLTTHHAFMHTFSNSTSVKIIENNKAVAYIEHSILQG